MIYECVLGAQIFGFINTTSEPYIIEQGNKYEVKKINTDKITYYEIIENDKVVTTISEEEFKVFFKN